MFTCISTTKPTFRTFVPKAYTGKQQHSSVTAILRGWRRQGIWVRAVCSEERLTRPSKMGEKMRGNSGSVSAACSTLTLIREIKEVGACSVLWRMMLSKHVLLSVILKLFCSFRLHAKIDLNERVNIWNSSEVSDLSCHVKKLKSWSVTKIKPNTQSVFIYTHYLTLCSLSEIK